MRGIISECPGDFIGIGTQPYLRAHAPLPDTPRTVILRLLPKGRIKAM